MKCIILYAQQLKLFMDIYKRLIWRIKIVDRFYLVKPRQTGKSVGICACLSWAFKFGVTNGQFMFAGNVDKTSKDNLKKMKTYLSKTAARVPLSNLNLVSTLPCSGILITSLR